MSNYYYSFKKDIRDKFYRQYRDIDLEVKPVASLIASAMSEDELSLAEKLIDQIFELEPNDEEYLYQLVENQKYEISWGSLPF